ncbi:MAG TPA: nuclear transport factor 2 family protein [Pseudomonadales bacterium]|nr:nuclear transport factor 2 family protein [Pseudomonadales bacterium]
MADTNAAMLQLADSFFGAIEGGDVETLRRLYADDARIWHNFDDVEQNVDDNLRVLAWLQRHLHDRRYEVIRRQALPDGFLQQHVLRGRTDAGEAFAMPACVICRVAEGRITRLDEYLDPAATAALSRRTT